MGWPLYLDKPLKAEQVSPHRWPQAKKGGNLWHKKSREDPKTPVIKTCEQIPAVSWFFLLIQKMYRPNSSQNSLGHPENSLYLLFISMPLPQPYPTTVINQLPDMTV